MKYVIVANGDFLTKDIVEEAVFPRETCVLIALDGAIDKLAKYGFLPDVLMGDFDSVDKKFWQIPDNFKKNLKETKSNIFFSEKNGFFIVNTPDQNHTDLSKAIIFSDEKRQLSFEKLNKPATRIDILCALGGARPDHTIGNIRSLRKHFKKDRPIWLHTQAYSLCFLKNMEYACRQKKSNKKHQTAILGMPEGAFQSTGLKWNGITTSVDNIDSGLNGYKLYPGHDSTCNLLDIHSEELKIKISGEAVIMLPGLFDAQKKYETGDQNLERAILEEKLQLFDYELIRISSEELNEKYFKLKSLKEVVGIKQYSKKTNKKIEDSKFVRTLKNEQLSSGRLCLFAIHERKLKKLQALDGYKEKEIILMNKTELEELSKKIGY